GHWGKISKEERQEWIEAAVLVLCYPYQGQDYLVLTRRTEEIPHHKGQVCFPGGVRDPVDRSLWDTALRETHEEIGLAPSQVTWVKELHQQFTPTGFLVTPYVGRIREPIVWTPNPFEISEIFSVPFDYFRDRKNLHIFNRTYQGREYR